MVDAEGARSFRNAGDHVAKSGTAQRPLWFKVLIFLAMIFIIYIAMRVVMKQLGLEQSTQAQQQEAWIRDWIQLLQDVASVMETVKDQATAKAAAPKLRELAVRIESMAERQKHLQKVSSNEGERILQTYMPEMAKVQKRMADLAPKVQEFNDGTSEFSAAMTRILESAGKMQIK
jgi:hypothetical protein